MHRSLLVVMFVSLLAMFIPSGSHVRAAQETLYVPFENGPSGVQTANTFNGKVTITVSGSGQAAGTQFSDAFYIFTDEFGNPRFPEHIDDFGLYVNDTPADNYVSLPAYRPDHTYSFSINAKGERLRFRFAVGDSFTADNTGGFTVAVKNGNSSEQSSYLQNVTDLWKLVNQVVQASGQICKTLECGKLSKPVQIIDRGFTIGNLYSAIPLSIQLGEDLKALQMAIANHGKGSPEVCAAGSKVYNTNHQLHETLVSLVPGLEFVFPLPVEAAPNCRA